MIPAALVCTTFAGAAFVELEEGAPLFVVEAPVLAADLVGEEPAGEEPAGVVVPPVVAPAPVVAPPVVAPAPVVAPPVVAGGAAVPPEPEGCWPKQLLSPESLIVTAAVWAS